MFLLAFHQSIQIHLLSLASELFLLHIHFLLSDIKFILKHVTLLRHDSSHRTSRMHLPMFKISIFLSITISHMDLACGGNTSVLLWQGQHFPRGSTYSWVVVVSLLWFCLKMWSLAITTHSNVLFVCSQLHHSMRLESASTSIYKNVVRQCGHVWERHAHARTHAHRKTKTATKKIIISVFTAMFSLRKNIPDCCFLRHCNPEVVSRGNVWEQSHRYWAQKVDQDWC